MRSTRRILLHLVFFTVLLINKQDKKVFDKDSSGMNKTTTFGTTQTDYLRKRVKLGIRKQSLSRLELSVGEQRTL